MQLLIRRLRSRLEQRRSTGAAARQARSQEGYTLAFLMVAVTVMNVMVAIAMPSWTTYVQREKEEELIFRGLQYAEAIRVFQKANNRLPVSLEELYKTKPRSIRQLYPDPMTESGNWGLLIQAAGAPAAGQAAGGGQGSRGVGVGGGQAPGTGAGRQGAQNPPGQNAGRPGGRAGGGQGGVVAVPPAKEGAGTSSFGEPIQRTNGPIVGVYSAAEGKAIRKFMNAESYAQWQFKVDLLPVPAIVGDMPAPRVTSAWIGKPFREDIQVNQPGAGGQLPQGGLPGQNVGGRGGLGGQRGGLGGGGGSSFRPSGKRDGGSR